MPRKDYGRKCEFCKKIVSTPCETKNNSKTCFNLKIKTIKNECIKILENIKERIILQIG